MVKGNPDNSWRVIQSRTSYANRWFKVKETILETPDKTTLKYFTLETKDAVATAAFTRNGKIILTRQYRPPLGKVIYNLPAGFLREGEPPKKGAARELEEEAGFVAGKLMKLGEFHWNPGLLSGKVHLFLAKDLTRTTQRLDPTEFIELDFVSFDLALSKVRSGEWTDSALVISVLKIASEYFLGNPFVKSILKRS